MAERPSSRNSPHHPPRVTFAMTSNPTRTFGWPPLENGLSDSNANRASCPPPRTKAHGATAARDLGTRRQTACPCLRIKASWPKGLEPFWEARRNGERRTSADAHRGWAGILGVTPDPAARSGRPAATYGSGGWGFESLRVHQCIPLSKPSLSRSAKANCPVTPIAARIALVSRATSCPRRPPSRRRAPAA